MKKSLEHSVQEEVYISSKRSQYIIKKKSIHHQEETLSRSQYIIRKKSIHHQEEIIGRKFVVGRVIID